MYIIYYHVWSVVLHIVNHLGPLVLNFIISLTLRKENNRYIRQNHFMKISNLDFLNEHNLSGISSDEKCLFRTAFPLYDNFT